MMVYIAVIVLGLVSFYLLTFARHNWKKNNKMAAVGIVLLALAAFVYPVVILVLRW
ncbi:MAG: hypothetical protein GYA02_10255 [Clostridiaceae bacterium]|jgi:heme/copper-type cytochrome/quinol oxidase subunit 2|nr:hypothetical protein [Clostridiaceae bacterium]